MGRIATSDGPVRLRGDRARISVSGGAVGPVLDGLKLWLDASRASVGARSPDTVADLAAWYKADAITGLADGAAVGTWSDSSGNGNHLTQSTAANKPIYKTNIQNSLPVVRFVDTSDVMKLTAFTGGTLSQPLTVFAVAQTSTAAAGNPLLFDGVDSTNRVLLGKKASSSKFYAFAGGAIEGAAVDSAWHVHSMVYNGASSFLGIDGGGAAGDMGTNTWPGFTLGAAYDNTLDWLGDVAELLVFDRALTQTERAGIEKYLADKYALTVTGAPYVDADPVQLWPDLSGNGNHLTQSTAADKPTFKTGIQNSLPVVRFDGTADVMTATLIDGGSDETFFVVAKRTGGSASYQLLLTTRRNGCYGRLTADTWGSFQAVDLSSGQNISSAFKIASVVARAANDIDLVTDGALVNVTGGSGLRNAANTRLGGETGEQFFGGDIAEVLVYDRALSTPELQQVNRYLGNKWGVVIG